MTGSWQDPSRWSPAIVPNNSGGDTYDVTIAAATPAAFNVISTGTLTLDSLTIDSPKCSVSSSGSTTIGTLHIASGTFTAFNDLRDAYVLGQGTLSASILNNATLAGELAVGGQSMIVANGLALVGADVNVYQRVTCSGTQSISGSGKLTLHSATLSAGSGISTVGANVAIEAAGGTCAVSGFVIGGALIVGPSGTLAVSGVQNAGSITVDHGTLKLLDSALLSAPGTFTRNGGTVILAASVANNGNTLDVVHPVLGLMELGGATIGGGTLTSSAGPISVRSNNSLVGVYSSSDFDVRGRLGLDPATRLDGSHVTLAGGTLTGDGRLDNSVVSFASPMDGFRNVLVRTGSGTTTLIRTDGGSGEIRNASPAQPSFTNNGTIVSNQPGAFIRISPNFVNTGTLVVADGGGISLAFPFTNTGTITGTNGRVALRGPLTPAAFDTHQLTNPEFIVCGPLTTTSPLDVRTPDYSIGLGDGGSISNTTLLGQPSDLFRVTNTSASTISGTPAASMLSNVLAQVTIDVDGGNLRDSGSTNARAILVRNAGTLELSENWNNQGGIHASSGTIILASTPPTGYGTISLTDGTLALRTLVQGSSLDQILFTRSTTLVDAGATVLNAGHTIVLDSEQASLELGSGAISGGTITSTGATSRFTTLGGGTLTDVSLSGTMEQVLGAQPTFVTGTLRLTDGTLTLSRANTSTSIWTRGDVVIDGVGEINARYFGAEFPAVAIKTTGTLTIGEGITYRGTETNIFFTGNTGDGVLLRGKMICETALPGSISGFSGFLWFDNQGLVQVGGGTTFTTDRASLRNVANRTLTGGRWWVGGNSTLLLGTANTIDVNNAEVRLDGIDSVFPAIDSLAQNLGTLSIMGGRSFATIGSFTNAGTLVVGAGSSLKINGLLANTGTIDVNDALLIDYPPGGSTPRPEIEAQIAFARNGGSWDQPGITSSSARHASPPATTLGVLEGSDYRSIYGSSATFGGFQVDDSSVLVRYSRYGDTDFSDLVDFDDYARIDFGFNTGASGWLNGDFDYTGSVDFDDYVLIDLGFNTQNGTLRRAMDFLDGTDRGRSGMDADPALVKVVEHSDRFGVDYALHFLAAVPEPTSAAGVVALSVWLGVAARGRRSRRITLPRCSTAGY